MTDNTTATITASRTARRLVELMQERHGPLTLHVSGSYGVSVICLPRSELHLGNRDVLIGSVLGVPVYMLSSEVKYWRGLEITLDVSPGRAAGFSLEAPEGFHFTLRKRECPVEKLKQAVGADLS
jgi:uncharacterized protein (DUF779 family)